MSAILTQHVSADTNPLDGYYMQQDCWWLSKVSMTSATSIPAPNSSLNHTPDFGTLQNATSPKKSHMLIPPPGISISNVSSFCKKKDLQIQHPTAKMTFQAAVTIKLITSEPSHLGHNVTCGGWSNLSAKETCSYDKIWPECWRDLPHKKSENFTKTDGKIYIQELIDILWNLLPSTWPHLGFPHRWRCGGTHGWLESHRDGTGHDAGHGAHGCWRLYRAGHSRHLVKDGAADGFHPQERASPAKKAFLYQWFLG